MTRDPDQRRVRWKKTYRVISSRFPPIALFERCADPSQWEHLAVLEGLTNPRIRAEIGKIAEVPLEDRITGPGSSWVMAAFTHTGRKSRFSDGSYGVYYCGRALRTAVAETAYHYGLFYKQTDTTAMDFDVRILVGRVDASLHALTNTRRDREVLSPNDYGPSQALGRRLQEAGSRGIVYPSVRQAGGECLAIFKAKVAGIPVQGTHLCYHFDGSTVSRYFDYANEGWQET